MSNDECFRNIVKFLLESGAALNIANDDGETPLHTASRHGHVDILKMLLEQPVFHFHLFLTHRLSMQM